MMALGWPAGAARRVPSGRAAPGRAHGDPAAAVWRRLSPRQREALAALARGPLHRVRAGWCHDLGEPAFSDATLAVLGRPQFVADAQPPEPLARRTGGDWQICPAGRAVLAAGGEGPAP